MTFFFCYFCREKDVQSQDPIGQLIDIRQKKNVKFSLFKIYELRPLKIFQIYKVNKIHTKHTHTPSFWPQANGLVEKQNTGIKKRLQISKAMGSESWQDDSLINYLVMYRSTPQDTTGKSPFELMFNRKMRDKLPIFMEPQRGELDEEVRLRDEMKKEKMKEIADRKRRARESTIKTGDKVLLKNLPGNKLTTNFDQELYTAVEVNERDCVVVSAASGVQRRRNIVALKKSTRCVSTTNFGR